MNLGTLKGRHPIIPTQISLFSLAKNRHNIISVSTTYCELKKNTPIKKLLACDIFTVT